MKEGKPRKQRKSINVVDAIDGKLKNIIINQKLTKYAKRKKRKCRKSINNGIESNAKLPK